MKAPTKQLETAIQQTALEIARNAECKLLNSVIEGYYKRYKDCCSLQEFTKLIEEKLSKLNFVAKK